MAVDGTVWPIEPHTLAKHRILRRYLDAWLPIMARWNPRIVIIDGFAGPGRYVGGEEGSPLVALRALLEHPHMQTRAGLEVRFWFIEERADRATALDQELATFRAQWSLPSWVHVEVANTEFAPFLSGVLTEIETRKQALAPTFAFIDPFGFSGVPMQLIERIARNSKCEVLISFMLESINRWAWFGNAAIEAHLDELFGTTAWKALAQERDPVRRRDGLVDLYRTQLVTKAGLPCVINFEMVDHGNRTEYFLYFGTKSLKGLSVMKQAMWKVDPMGGQLFADRVDPNQLVLMPAMAAPASLRELLQREFRGKGWVSTDELEDVEVFVLTKTIYSEKMHLRRSTLAPMEREGLIEVRRPVGKKAIAGRYPEGTRIQFR
jgi:three-Cys-motif partner protein